MNARAIANHCLNLSFYDLQDFAGENYNVVYEYIKRTSNVSPNSVLVGTIFTCIATDGRLSDDEWNFIAMFIGGYSYDEALQTAGDFYCEDARRVARDFVKVFPPKVREAYVSMCIAVLAVDKRFGDDEIDFLNSLL